MKAKEIKKPSNPNKIDGNKPIIINSSSIKRVPLRKGGCCGKKR